MKRALWLIDKLFGRRIARQTRQHLADLANAPVRASRERTSALLECLASEPGPDVHLGETEWGQPVRLSLPRLVQGHSIITGGTGSGKTMAAGLLIEAILRVADQGLSFGVLDAKGDLFARALYLIAARLQELPEAQAQRLKERIVIIDFSSTSDPATSYNIAAPWAGACLDVFAQSRVDTFEDLLPSGDGLSLRGGGIVKHVIKLMAELSVPFSYFDQILGSEAFRQDLLAKSCDDDLKRYFHQHFPNENRATIAAVRARIAATLLNAPSIKAALSGRDTQDFRQLQDEGKIVLVNVGGPHIARTTARTLQSILLSDIRQAIFHRTSEIMFLWVIDEAAQLFRNRHVREAFVDILTLSRSYRSFCMYLTQSLSTAVQEGDALENFYTNIKWSLSLRCGTSRDVAFLEPALPVTGQIQKARRIPYAAPEFYRPSEERALMLSRMSSLPDRVGWLWLKSLAGEALKITTRTLALPGEAEFHETVESLKADAELGHRIPRSVYLADIVRREKELAVGDAPSKLEELKKAYRRNQEVVQ
jgi:hypothetical protein